jgi:hypothetical protein
MEKKSQEKLEQKFYFEAPEKAVEKDNRFEHVMALALNPQTNYQDGIIRCITKREGDIKKKGCIDRSLLYKIKGGSNDKFTITEKLQIKKEDEIISGLEIEGYDFIGLEDPDIWLDENKDILHVYFTIAFVKKVGEGGIVGIGHAQGKNLDSLEMTDPVIMDTSGKNTAKELSIAPTNSQGIRLNLMESSSIINDTYYSTIRITQAKNMSSNWEFGETIFHPKEHDIYWAGEHASPGSFFSKNFIDLGENRLLGVMNGREKSRVSGTEVNYAMFSVGLFVYNYEKGEIDWISPVPFIQDSQAETITFASQLVEASNSEATIYAHVDDSFVRAYSVEKSSLKAFLKQNGLNS